MCEAHNPRVIDKCMRPLISWLNKKHCTVACCCGHKRYSMTIVVKEGIDMPVGQKNKIVYREILSQKIIPRKRRFYIKDKEGYYYIPEVSVYSLYIDDTNHFKYIKFKDGSMLISGGKNSCQRLRGGL